MPPRKTSSIESRAEGAIITRRTALKGLGLGLGMAAGGGACLPHGNRCGAGPADAGAGVTTPSLLSGIDTFVVVMMENRSFDHLFGALRLDPAYPARDRVDGLRGDEMNLAADGTPVAVHHVDAIDNYGPSHTWDAAHMTFDDGRNDAFVRVNVGPTQTEAMAYHDRRNIPFHYALADNFTVCDRWFASVMGPTWPNRYFLHAATSTGIKDNTVIRGEGPTTIWELMADRCRSAKNYAAGPVPWYTAAFLGKSVAGTSALVPDKIESFFRDARQGTLPELAMVDPDYLLNDMHPPHSIPLSEAFLNSIYRAMAESPQWSRSMLIVVYDEHGGFFDHVPPPPCPDSRPEFRRLGFRVPAIVAGPTVWRGGVCRTVLEHVSIMSTMRARFGIDSVGERMDAAGDLSGCIDPALAAAPAPPPVLPVPEVDVAALTVVPGPSGHDAIDRMLAAGVIPDALVDGRSPQERLTSWARHARDLGAVKVIE